jgi:hypothetical protein
MISEKFSFILDDVLDKQYFKNIQEDSRNTTFKTIQSEGRQFHVAYPPKDLSLKIQKAIEEVYRCKIQVVNSFLRMYTQFLNNNWGIHADRNVLSETSPSHGAVFFLSENLGDINGTAFWSHEKYGLSLPEITDNEAHGFTSKSYNNENEWEVNSIIGGVENRLISYPSNYFHSKFPKQAWGTSQKDCRLILAMFYNLKS